MKKFSPLKIGGIVLGCVALFFAVKNIHGEEFVASLRQMNHFWIVPIIMANFLVILVKSYRWQIFVRPVKHVGIFYVFKIMLIGFMANNVLPARLGEPLRMQLMGKGKDLSRVTTSATMIADRIVEGVSFLFIAAILIIFSDVPTWMMRGILITLIIIGGLYAAMAIYSHRDLKNPWLIKFQDGMHALLNVKILSIGFATSMVSWVLQLAMIYMTQQAFGVETPIWGILLVLVTVNLAVAIPAAPAHVGTFEYACVLAYTYLGVSDSLGFLIGITYHLLQAMPVTLAGGALLLFHRVEKSEPIVSQAS